MAKGNATKSAPKKEFDNTNSGALFVNDKGGNEKRPDHTGVLTLNPDDFTPGDDGLIKISLAAWIKTSDRVGEFLSIKASPFKEQ